MTHIPSFVPTISDRVGQGDGVSSLVADLVLAPLLAGQNNVFANVRDWEEDEKRRWDKLVRTGREADHEPENPPTPALARLDGDPLMSAPLMPDSSG